MEKIIQINFSGHAETFRCSEEAYTALTQYLERARLRLKNDPDHAEVIRDLERSIGEKLSARVAGQARTIEVADVAAVLAEVGQVDPGNGAPNADAPRRSHRFMRIEEGKDILGVCLGLSEYSKIDVEWLRFLFLVLAGVTGGIFILVYFAMAFFMPVAATRAEYAAMQDL
jgi:phage shock protein PspC (stress-responsive transcriptional regulator)